MVGPSLTAPICYCPSVTVRLKMLSVNPTASYIPSLGSSSSFGGRPATTTRACHPSPCRAPHFGGGMVTAIRCPSSRLLASLSPCPLGEHHHITSRHSKVAQPVLLLLLLPLATSTWLRFKKKIFSPAVIQGQLVGQERKKKRREQNFVRIFASICASPFGWFTLVVVCKIFICFSYAELLLLDRTRGRATEMASVV